MKQNETKRFVHLRPSPACHSPPSYGKVKGIQRNSEGHRDVLFGKLQSFNYVHHTTVCQHLTSNSTSWRTRVRELEKHVATRATLLQDRAQHDPAGGSRSKSQQGRFLRKLGVAGFFPDRNACKHMPPIVKDSR